MYNLHYLSLLFSNQLSVSTVGFHDVRIRLAGLQYLIPVVRVIRDHSAFLAKQFVDLIVYEEGDGLRLLYVLYSPVLDTRFMVVVDVDWGLLDLAGPSLLSLYWGLSWPEREVYDMFGYYFHNHGDLRRLLTDYGFCGNPLHKSYQSYSFIFYDEVRKGCFYSLVS